MRRLVLAAAGISLWGVAQPVRMALELWWLRGRLVEFRAAAIASVNQTLAEE